MAFVRTRPDLPLDDPSSNRLSARNVLRLLVPILEELRHKSPEAFRKLHLSPLQEGEPYIELRRDETAKGFSVADLRALLEAYEAWVQRSDDSPLRLARVESALEHS